MSEKHNEMVGLDRPRSGFAEVEEGVTEPKVLGRKGKPKTRSGCVTCK